MGREDSGRAGFATAVVVALAIGLVVGWGEVVALGWRYFVRAAVTHVSPHAVWMAPLGYGGLFLLLTPLGLIFARSSLRVVVFLCLTLGLIGWVTMVPVGLHAAAVIVLSAGAAAQLTKRAVRDESALAAHARKTVLVLGGLTVVAAAIAFAFFGTSESRAYGARGEARDGAPNVILLVLDTVRAKSLGLHGGPDWVSPNIDLLVDDAVVFDNALATSPWTLPSHGSMFTGLLPHDLSLGWSTPMDDAEPTLAEALAARGYATAGFVANLSYGARAYGLHRGFAHYEDFPLGLGQTVLSMSLGRAVTTADWLRARLDNHELLNRKLASEINADFLSWLEGRPDGPFFAFLNYFDAHEPYEPPIELRDRVAPGYVRDNVGHRHNLLRGINARRLLKAEMPAADMPLELALYEATIHALDAEIGALMDELETRGLLENTVIVLTSDHGEHMGEHGIFEHGQTLYEAAIHVPLIVRPAGGIEGRRVERAVSIRDIPSTVMDLVAAEPQLFPGATLVPTWHDDPEVRNAAEVSLAVAELSRGTVEQPWYPIAPGLDMQAMQSGSLYYICNPDGTEELYDLATDPEESNNLVGTPVGNQAVLAFRDVIATVEAPPRWCPPPPDEAPRRPDRRRP